MREFVAVLQNRVLGDLVSSALAPVLSHNMQSEKTNAVGTRTRSAWVAELQTSEVQNISFWVFGRGTYQSTILRFCSLLEIAARLDVIPAPLPSDLRVFLEVELNGGILTSVDPASLPCQLRDRLLSDRSPGASQRAGLQGRNALVIDEIRRRAYAAIDNNVIAFWGFLDAVNDIEYRREYQAFLRLLLEGQHEGIHLAEFEAQLASTSYEPKTLEAADFAPIDLLIGMNQCFHLVQRLRELDTKAFQRTVGQADIALTHLLPLVRGSTTRASLARIARRAYKAHLSGVFSSPHARRVESICTEKREGDDALSRRSPPTDLRARSGKAGLKLISPTSGAPRLGNVTNDEGHARAKRVQESVVLLGLSGKTRARFMDAYRGVSPVVVAAALAHATALLEGCPTAAVVVGEGGSEPLDQAEAIRQIRTAFPRAAILAICNANTDLHRLVSVGANMFMIDGLDDTKPALMMHVAAARISVAAEVVCQALARFVPPKLHRVAEAAARPFVTSVPALADELGVHRKTLHNWHLRARFMPPGELLSWVRLALVGFFLDGSASVERIAYELRYPSVTSLRNTILRYTGKTASELRQGVAFDAVIAAMEARINANLLATDQGSHGE